jgi:hypothetical protein
LWKFIAFFSLWCSFNYSMQSLSSLKWRENCA